MGRRFKHSLENHPRPHELEQKTIRITRRTHTVLALLRFKRGDSYLSDTLEAMLEDSPEFKRLYDKTPTPRPRAPNRPNT